MAATKNIFLAFLFLATPLYAEHVTVQFPRMVDDDTVHKCFVSGVRTLKDVDFQKASMVVEYDPMVTDLQKLSRDLKKALGFDVTVKQAESFDATAAPSAAASTARKKQWVKPGGPGTR